MSSVIAERMGRPPVLDEVRRAEVCALLASGCSYRTAGAYVGCTASAISMAAKRDAGFAAEIEKAVAQRETILLSHLRESSKRSWRAAAWLLEKTVGGKYGGQVPTLDEEVEREQSAQLDAFIRGNTSGGTLNVEPAAVQKPVDAAETRTESAAPANAKATECPVTTTVPATPSGEITAESIKASMEALTRRWSGKAARKPKPDSTAAKPRSRRSEHAVEFDLGLDVDSRHFPELGCDLDDFGSDGFDDELNSEDDSS